MLCRWKSLRLPQGAGTHQPAAETRLYWSRCASLPTGTQLPSLVGKPKINKSNLGRSTKLFARMTPLAPLGELRPLTSGGGPPVSGPQHFAIFDWGPLSIHDAGVYRAMVGGGSGPGSLGQKGLGVGATLSWNVRMAALNLTDTNDPAQSWSRQCDLNQQWRRWGGRRGPDLWGEGAKKEVGAGARANMGRVSVRHLLRLYRPASAGPPLSSFGRGPGSLRPHFEKWPRPLGGGWGDKVGACSPYCARRASPI